MSPAELTIYCERAGAGLWAEPLNAASNLSFLLAAALSWRRLPPRPPRDLLAAVLLLVAVGVGSALWHTVAAPWAQVADVAPILLLVTTLLGSSLRRLLRLPWRPVIILLITFVAANGAAAAAFPPPLLNGSLPYAPTWLALALLAGARRGHPEAGRLFAATALFGLALVFRTVDLTVCPAFPWGTHFAWHILNGLVLYLVLQALTGSAPRGQASR